MHNESEETAAFETLCGGPGLDHAERGVERAQRLFRLYKTTYSTGTAYDFAMGRGRTKECVFKKRATEEGFTMPEINAFFRLQK